MNLLIATETYPPEINGVARTLAQMVDGLAERGQGIDAADIATEGPLGHSTLRAFAAHYASGDLFLFPNQTETFGNVTLEAMACGLAVVSYDLAAATVPSPASSSRLVLGLHFPSDVISGAAIGGSAACSSLVLLT